MPRQLSRSPPAPRVTPALALAASDAGRPKSEPAPGSLEYQALHPDWKPQE
jgi:hypothetical protein